MKLPSFKTIFIIQLFGAMIILGILSSKASAWTNVGVEDLCCNHSEGDGQTGTDPCSTPACSCVLCLIDYSVVPHPNFSTTLRKAYHDGDPQVFHLSEFIRSIDYPPETI